MVSLKPYPDQPVYYRIIKRGMDIVASMSALIILAPFLVIIVLVIFATNPGPVFYKGRRIGLYGQEFGLLKFRSMVVNADKVGPGITTSDDPRVTGIGRILRRTKLDELPQLFNVLAGDMSIVGPRPEAPDYVELYTDEQRQVLCFKPGITSPASIVYRYEESLLNSDDWEIIYINEVMPAKLAIDLEYVHSATLWRDIVIILRTFLVLFR